MKSAFFVSVSLVFLAFPVFSQNPAVDAAKKRLTDRNNTGNSGGVVIPNQPRQQTIVSYITYLSKDREWVDAKGRKMTGRLVAFSAPEPGKTGNVVVIHDGKVRLRRTGAKANSEIPVTQLSDADQIFVKAIDAGIKKSAATTSAASTAPSAKQGENTSR